MNSEIHLFIVWGKARNKQNDILDDIKKKFQICDIFDISWNKRNFASNLTRFYGLKLPSRSSKERHCGTKAFLLVIVRDLDPNYENRDTSTGIARVNVATFDCKVLYRSWTGGGHRIHATNNPEETRHDLALLLGSRAELYLAGSGSTWDGTINLLKRDLAGAETWESLEEFFYVLNNTVNYVVMRNFDELPCRHESDIHGDIDLLTDNYANLCYIANAKRVFRKSYRVHHTVAIRENDVYFDFRYVGDSYYCELWQKDMITTRVYRKEGIFVPTEENHFFSLLYHAAVHKPKIAGDYVNKILQIAKVLGENINEEDLGDSNWLNKFLLQFFEMRGYSFSDPIDLSVFFNVDVVGRISFTKRRLVAKIFSLPLHKFKQVVKFLIRWESRA